MDDVIGDHTEFEGLAHPRLQLIRHPPAVFAEAGVKGHRPRNELGPENEEGKAKDKQAHGGSGGRFTG
jgi:hypothetical protein